MSFPKKQIAAMAVGVALAIGVSVAIFGPRTPGEGEIKGLAYSGFLYELNANHVDSVMFAQQEGVLHFRSKAPAPIARVDYPSALQADLIKTLSARNIAVSMEPTSRVPIATVNAWGPSLLLLAGLFWVGLAQRRSASKRKMSDDPSLRFVENEDLPNLADVVCPQETVDDVREVIDFLKKGRQLNSIGATMPRGVLLIGPPGTGKTMLAQAIAREAGVPFIYRSGSDIDEVYVGLGAARIRETFDLARKNAPSVVFIDEIDALVRGSPRADGSPGEDDQSLTQLLVEMDGFKRSSDQVLVLAATNHPERLPARLLRAGRFTRQIAMRLPDSTLREKLIRSHLQQKSLVQGLSVDTLSIKLAAQTMGMSGADIANMINEAAIFAVRNGRSAIGAEELAKGRDRVIFGAEQRSRVLTQSDRRTLSCHEAGHAAVAYLHNRVVDQVSIIPRGKQIGATLLADGEHHLFQFADLRVRLMILLAGRAAETVLLDSTSSAAEDDLAEANLLARRMCFEWGMHKEIGVAVPGASPTDDDLQKLRMYVNTCFLDCERFVSQYRSQIEVLAQLLEDNEVLSASDVAVVFSDQS